jgi:hypothetical protein
MTDNCNHRWQLEPPVGRTFKGTCVHCGAERTFNIEKDFPDDYPKAQCHWAKMIGNKDLYCSGIDCPLEKCPDDIIYDAVETATKEITCGLAEIILEHYKGGV